MRFSNLPKAGWSASVYKVVAMVERPHAGARELQRLSLEDAKSKSNGDIESVASNARDVVWLKIVAELRLSGRRAKTLCSNERRGRGGESFRTTSANSAIPDVLTLSMRPETHAGWINESRSSPTRRGGLFCIANVKGVGGWANFKCKRE
jgi:hypothetical protein